MKQADTQGITVTKEEDFSEWYEQVVLKAELAEFSAVKGCMILRPRGYALWEGIQGFFDPIIKSKKVQNVYFPMFIPEKFFSMEAEHAQGFSPEVAWVTEAGGSQLPERLAIRPTSEAVITDAFSRWVRSHNDLPMKTNQWCSVVRWDTKATKLFLRSREFLWQEGHCLYETQEENIKEVLEFLEEYRRVAEDLLAVPVIKGKKTKKETFAGAVQTFTIEALMPDGKALQMGTSHEIGQGFAKVFGVQFLGKDGEKHYPHQSSWGISTRMIGALVMMHSDNKGLVLPPRIAPQKAVIIPIMFEGTKEAVIKQAHEICKLIPGSFVDGREQYTPGWKYNEWELKGIPLRLEIGPRDLEKKHVVVVRRDTGDKAFVKVADIEKKIPEILEQMQDEMLNKAKTFLKNNIERATKWEDFVDLIQERKLSLVPFCGIDKCEDDIKEKTGGATSRCIPLDASDVSKGAKCIHCGKEAHSLTYFGKAY